MCQEEPHPASSAGLCLMHWENAVRDWVAERPRMRMRCPLCALTQEFDSVELPTRRCDNCNADMSRPSVRPAEPYSKQAGVRFAPSQEDASVEGQVYYLRFGDRYKIGFTTNLKARLNSLPYDELLAVEPGSFKLERERHAMFASTRVEGQNEWFFASPHLLFHIATLEDRYGLPGAEVATRELISTGGAQ